MGKRKKWPETRRMDSGVGEEARGHMRCLQVDFIRELYYIIAIDDFELDRGILVWAIRWYTL